MPVIALLVLGVWVFALVDCISADSASCRNLPKVLWLLIVFFVPVLGSLLWFTLGRPPRAAWAPGRTSHASSRRAVARDDEPRYSPSPGISDRRSAELDLEIARWEEEQRERKRAEE